MVGLRGPRGKRWKCPYDRSSHFCQASARTRRQVSDADLSAVRSAAFSDGEIVEIIAHIALNALTNYPNIATDVKIDFRKISLTEAA